MTSLAWSRICCRLTAGSRRDILIFGFREHLAAEVAADGRRSVEVDGPIEQSAQFFLHPEEPEPRRPSRLELNQHVHVAVGTEIVAQCGPEHGKPTNAILRRTRPVAPD